MAEKRKHELPPPKIADLFLRTVSRLDQLLEKLALSTQDLDTTLRGLAKAWKIELPPAIAPPVVVPAPTVSVTVPGIPPTEIELPPTLMIPMPRYRNYWIAEDKVKSGEGKTYVIKDEFKIRMKLVYGYLKTDNGDIKVKINDQKEFTMKSGEVIYFHELYLEVEKIVISTDSATYVNFRILGV